MINVKNFIFNEKSRAHNCVRDRWSFGLFGLAVVQLRVSFEECVV